MVKKLLSRAGAWGGALLLITASTAIGLGHGRSEGDESNEEAGKGKTKGRDRFHVIWVLFGG
jgi:hypothetical protein